MGPTSSALQLRRAEASPRQSPSPGRLDTRQRDDLIASHIPMASRIARRFAGRGEDVEDLTQVAMLELVKAASRFDPTRGVAFAFYALPCIAGAIKKHFRDYGWSMHITRDMQELHLRTSRAIPALSQVLGRDPTITELAAHLQLSENDVRDGMHIRLAYNTKSVSRPIGDGEDLELTHLLGGPDERLESVLDRHLLGQLVTALPIRVRNILYLRYFVGLTQREIGERLGISQMHVSRLLVRCIDELRTSMLASD